MTAEEIELRYNMSKMTDEELMMIVSVNSGDYRQDALNIAGEELTRRGIPFTSAGDIVANYRIEPELKGVGGWLLFLCLRLTIIGPLLLMSIFWSILTDKVIKQYSVSFAIAPVFTIAYIIIIGSIYFGPTLFGIYAGFALWTVRKYAVGLAKIATVLFIGLNLFEFAVLILVTLKSQQEQQPVTAGPLFFSVCVLAGNVLWYLYLRSSTRVKNTYGK